MDIRTARLAGSALVAVFAAPLSFVGLEHLGARVGFGSWAPLLPLVIDTAVAMFSVGWLASSVGDKSRSWSRLMALTAIGTTIALNVAEHLAEGSGASTWLVVACASVPPVAFAGSAHAVALDFAVPDAALQPSGPARTVTAELAPIPARQRHRPALRGVPGVPAYRVVSTRLRAANRVTVPPEPVPVRRQAATRPAPAGDAVLLAKLAALAREQGGTPSIGKTRRALGIGSGRATRLLDDFARNGGLRVVGES